MSRTFLIRPQHAPPPPAEVLTPQGLEFDPATAKSWDGITVAQWVEVSVLAGGDIRLQVPGAADDEVTGTAMDVCEALVDATGGVEIAAATELADSDAPLLSRVEAQERAELLFAEFRNALLELERRVGSPEVAIEVRDAALAVLRRELERSGPVAVLREVTQRLGTSPDEP